MKYSAILYEMPQDAFTQLDLAYHEYECMHLVLDLYTRQKKARDVWAKSLWSELKPQLLLEGMDNYLKEFKQLPRNCRIVPIGMVLEANMKKFKSAIPLFIELKNDAMRDSHWEKLMDQTGMFQDKISTQNT